MIGAKISGKDLMKSLKLVEKLSLKLVESFALSGNKAIMMGGCLYVSKDAVTLINDPEISQIAFEGLVISY